MKPNRKPIIRRRTTDEPCESAITPEFLAAIEELKRSDPPRILKPGDVITRKYLDEPVMLDPRVLKMISAQLGNILKEEDSEARRKKFFALTGSCPDMPDTPPHRTPDIPCD